MHHPENKVFFFPLQFDSIEVNIDIDHENVEGILPSFNSIHNEIFISSNTIRYNVFYNDNRTFFQRTSKIS